jgi:hypothetical protein
MGQRLEKLKDKLSYGFAKAFVTLADLDAKYKIVTIALTIPVLVAGSPGWYLSPLICNMHKLVAMMGKKKDAVSLKDVGMEAIQKDFDSTYKTYVELKDTWGDRQEEKVLTQSDLEGVTQELKDDEVELHGKFHIHTFHSDLCGANLFGHSFISPTTKYRTEQYIMHESTHGSEKTKVRTLGRETEIENSAMKQLGKFVKDTPEEVNYCKDVLDNIADAFVRKAQNECMKREQIADYFKQHPGYTLPSYLEKVFTGSRIKRLSGRMHAKGLQCYTGNVYLAQKRAEAAKPVVETYQQPLCSKTA